MSLCPSSLYGIRAANCPGFAAFSVFSSKIRQYVFTPLFFCFLDCLVNMFWKHQCKNSWPTWWSSVYCKQPWFGTCWWCWHIVEFQFQMKMHPVFSVFLLNYISTFQIRSASDLRILTAPWYSSPSSAHLQGKWLSRIFMNGFRPIFHSSKQLNWDGR